MGFGDTVDDLSCFSAKESEVGKTGKAWHCHQYGKAHHGGILNFVDRSFPSVIPPNHILIQVKAASLNPIDYKLVQGDFDSVLLRDSSPSPPFRVGADYAGVVVQIGEGSTFEVGDEVFGDWFNHSSDDDGGSLSTYMLVPDKNTCLKPRNISFQQAAALPLTCGTHLHVCEAAHLKDGEKVLVLGASGGVGTGAIQMLKARGCHVTAYASLKNKKMCMKLGADAFIDYLMFPEWSTQWKGDLVLDYSPADGSSSWEQAIKGLRKEGRFLTISPDDRKTKINGWTLPALVTKGYFRNWTNDCSYTMVLHRAGDKRILEQIRAWVETGALKPVIDRVEKFEDVVAGFDVLMSQRAKGKIVIDVEGSGKYLSAWKPKVTDRIAIMRESYSMKPEANANSRTKTTEDKKFSSRYTAKKKTILKTRG